MKRIINLIYSIATYGLLLGVLWSIVFSMLITKLHNTTLSLILSLEIVALLIVLFKISWVKALNWAKR